jgi:hypothetical protein
MSKNKILIKSLSVLTCACILGISSWVVTKPEGAKAFDWSSRIPYYATGYLPYSFGTIQGIWFTPPMSSLEIATANSDAATWINIYSWDATPVSGKGPTIDYNCHAYAWWGSSAWINQFYTNPITHAYTSTPNLSIFWTSGYYTQIASSSGTIPSGVPDGAIVFYVNGDHSAVKTSSTKFTSKWGTWGEYVHSPTNAPYTSSSLKFYD